MSVRVIATCDHDLPLLSSDSRGHVLKTFLLIFYLNRKATLFKSLLRGMSFFCRYVLGKPFDPQECGVSFMSMFLDVQKLCVGVHWGGGMRKKGKNQKD